ERDGVPRQPLHQPARDGGLAAGRAAADADGQGLHGGREYHETNPLASADPAGRGCAHPMARDSAELTQIVTEANEIARATQAQPTTAHLLLATFTVPGPADVLLRERGCDEDAVLAELQLLGKPP